MHKQKTVSDILFEQQKEFEILSLFKFYRKVKDLPEYETFKIAEEEFYIAKNKLENSPVYKEFKQLESLLIESIENSNYLKSVETDEGSLVIRNSYSRLIWNTEILDAEAKRNPQLLRYKKNSLVKKTVIVEYS